MKPWRSCWLNQPREPDCSLPSPFPQTYVEDHWLRAVAGLTPLSSRMAAESPKPRTKQPGQGSYKLLWHPPEPADTDQSRLSFPPPPSSAQLELAAEKDTGFTTPGCTTPAAIVGATGVSTTAVRDCCGHDAASDSAIQDLHQHSAQTTGSLVVERDEAWPAPADACPVCMTEVRPQASAHWQSRQPCGHVMHRACTEQYFKHCIEDGRFMSIRCPLCPRVFTEEEILQSLAPDVAGELS